jgi:hypothetical protein
MYNDSKLSKEQWEKAEALCESDPILSVIWEHYKLTNTGSGKELIRTIDKYLKFVSLAVDVFCGISDEDKSELEELEIGFGSDEEATLRAKAKILLASKDDKSSDRIKEMLKIAKDLHFDRNEIYETLGRDDKEEIKQGSKSGARDLADRGMKKIIANSTE